MAPSVCVPLLVAASLLPRDCLLLVAVVPSLVPLALLLISPRSRANRAGWLALMAARSASVRSDRGLKKTMSPRASPARPRRRRSARRVSALMLKPLLLLLGRVGGCVGCVMRRAGGISFARTIPGPFRRGRGHNLRG